MPHLQHLPRLFVRLAAGAALMFVALAHAADFPAPKEGDWVARDFRFHTGEVVQELRLHYTTVGAPSGEPVLILHGTAGSGTGMLGPAFGGELFGPGQPLDATKFFIILPDAIGAGKSAKPSDGLRAKFPNYNYDDMVLAQYRLVTEGLGLRHLRLQQPRLNSFGEMPVDGGDVQSALPPNGLGILSLQVQRQSLIDGRGQSVGQQWMFFEVRNCRQKRFAIARDFARTQPHNAVQFSFRCRALLRKFLECAILRHDVRR